MKTGAGFDRDTWQQMVELGWAGITIPEEFGGLGYGHMGMGPKNLVKVTR
ncbi:MAG: acyl-CoA dehydrogenase family protein [Gammaproteobacteria bacterium]